MSELIFLNYFRWSPEMIAWKDLLLLLEGQQTVHLPSPKIHYALDITTETDTSIIATGKSEIKYICKFNSTDSVEDEMVSVRWKLLKFHHQISLAQRKDIAPCSTCFCKLAWMGELWIWTSLFLMVSAFLIHVTTRNKTCSKGFYYEEAIFSHVTTGKFCFSKKVNILFL